MSGLCSAEGFGQRCALYEGHAGPHRCDDGNTWYDTPHWPEETPPVMRERGAEHYRSMTIQPWDVVDEWPIEQQIGYHRGNCLKYAMRLGAKGAALQEAQKLAHYADKLVSILEAKADVSDA